MKPDTGSESRFLHTLPAFDDPVKGEDIQWHEASRSLSHPQLSFLLFIDCRYQSTQHNISLVGPRHDTATVKPVPSQRPSQLCSIYRESSGVNSLPILLRMTPSLVTEKWSRVRLWWYTIHLYAFICVSWAIKCPQKVWGSLRRFPRSRSWWVGTLPENPIPTLGLERRPIAFLTNRIALALQSCCCWNGPASLIWFRFDVVRTQWSVVRRWLRQTARSCHAILTAPPSSATNQLRRTTSRAATDSGPAMSATAPEQVRATASVVVELSQCGLRYIWDSQLHFFFMRFLFSIFSHPTLAASYPTNSYSSHGWLCTKF